MRDWIEVNRRPAIALVIVAAPFARDLLRSPSPGETFFDATWIVWCLGFMVWFCIHPLAAASATSTRGLEEPEPVEDADLRTIRIEPATSRRRDLDPAEQARLRFRVREEEPAPERVEDRPS
jgi:hypothetical protein